MQAMALSSDFPTVGASQGGSFRSRAPRLRLWRFSHLELAITSDKIRNALGVAA
jgi:hypothetical protein